jgi:ubiquitin carboxyl-terminal hydrolase 7
VRFWQGTAVEGTIQQLFEGHHMNYIECINVDYKSTRKESFYGTLVFAVVDGGYNSQFGALLPTIVRVTRYAEADVFFLADLQLDVKGCKDVYESFDKYVEVERLEGDNKYHAEQLGLQVRTIMCGFYFCFASLMETLREVSHILEELACIATCNSSSTYAY